MMQTLLRTLSLLHVLLCVEMKSQSGNAVTGTEGGSVEIYCTYPEEYQYVTKYFCRDPCGYSDVVIKTEKTHKVISKGRYSILNTVSTRSFSVTIKNLRLGDSGVYYCGADSWLKDPLRKVMLTVRKVNPKPTASPLSTPQTTKSTDLSSISRVLHITADTPKPTALPLSTLQTIKSTDLSRISTALHITAELPVYGGVVGLMLCSVLVALVVLYRRPSHIHSTSLKASAPENLVLDPRLVQDGCCSCDETIVTMYNFTGPANGNHSSDTYSIVQYHSD